MNVTIRKLLLAAGLCATAWTTSTALAATQIIDQVVAIVDDDIVMSSELQARVAAVKQNLGARGVTLPPEEEIINETLDRLILESIQLQMGTRVGVRISDAQLNQAVTRIASQNRMTLDEFRQALEAQGQSYPAMREQVRQEMIIQRVQAGNVNQRIQITEQEVDNFVSTETGQKLTQPEYHMLHALLPVSADASDSEASAAQAYVEKLLRRIRGGQPFDKVIGSSQPPYAFSGGDLGWRKRDDLPSLFIDIAPTLSAGQTSEPIRSDNGFHLIYMAETRGGEEMIAQTEVRHILIKPSEIMTDGEARQLALSLRGRIANGEDFGELAREYSEDIGSAQEGGELGWTSPGQMVPEFEATVQQASLGEISEPVRTKFGWHILEVTGRRDQDMTDEASRGKAMDYLHSRKYQEELDAWLRQIRDEAYVDIK